MPTLYTHFLPSLVAPEALAGSTAVVIDVLRATTTILHALAAGATEVLPCLEIEEARRQAANLPAGQGVLGGERGGVRIEGFQLGNSPSEYNAATVGKKTVVFTTTNGTRAMLHCRQAKRVLLGAFVNLTPLVEQLATEDQVHLICAGTRGEITREDVLVAGAVVSLLRLREIEMTLNDQAVLAADAWRAAIAGEPAHPVRLTTILASCLGGRDLIELGLEPDLHAAAQIDRVPLVAELDLSRWAVRAT